jgi:hypothetical protein
MPRRRSRRSESTAPTGEPDPTYLELARRIRDEVERAARDDTAFVLSIQRAIDGLAQDERARFTLQVFDALDAERQLGLLRELFDDDELRATLSAEMAERLRRSGHSAAERALVERAVRGTGFDLALLPGDVEIILGLFRADDVSAALPLGPRSDLCARELRCRTGDEPGQMTVINDTFNPRGSLTVTADYDRERWEQERLASHDVVRIGSIAPHSFRTSVHRGARVDVEVDGTARPGVLHLGYAILGATEVFSDR